MCQVIQIQVKLNLFLRLYKKIMKSLFLPFILIHVVGFICITTTGKKDLMKDVVYYVLPTEPLSSCPGNSSCPPGQLCHTMDYLAEHSSKFFSPDHVSVTLTFMCGVHNCTKDLTVQNLHSFVMKGAAESRENVIIILHKMVSQIAHFFSFSM